MPSGGDEPLRLARPSRVPAVLPAVSLAVGIAVDRHVAVAGTSWTLAGLVAVGLFWLAVGLRTRLGSAVALVLATVCLGGVLHHRVWSWVEPTDVARYAESEPRLVRLRGELRSAPGLRRKPAVSRTSFTEFDRTILDLQVHEIVERTSGGERPIAVSGRCRVSVTGHLPTLDSGDRVEVVCWMARPRPPSNPGEFDFAAWLRGRGARVTCWTNHPEAVVRTGEGRGWTVARASSRLRASVERLLHQSLSERTAPLAAALIVGSRQTVPDDVRADFAESGTLHLLAISGLHVGILATFVWFGCRLAGCGNGTTVAVLLVVLAGYAMVTGARPSVLRASLFVAIAVVGRLGHRAASPFQVLSLAAAVLLAWRPTDLFDPGAQLSFLAAAAIAFTLEAHSRLRRKPASVDDLVERGVVGRVLFGCREFLWASTSTMAVIWLFAAPLVAHRFHVVSPVGLVVNVFLVPAIVPVMWCGYAFVILATTVGAGAEPFAWAFDVGLRGLLEVVRVAGEWELGHRYLAGPSWLWTAGFYVGVAALLIAARRPGGPVRVGAALAFWAVVGLTAMQPQPERELRCTFLSVGHGSAVYLELPNGRNLLFDAGSLTAPEYADRVVRSAVWQSGADRIDVAVASHADVDHFNALVDVSESVPVDVLVVTPAFLDFEQGFVAELCEVAAGRGTRIELLNAGDRVRLDEDVRVEVLHPLAGETYESDNAASIVLLVEYRGRRILLTGDVEEDGLDRLLARPPVDVDVLAAPHHGSPKANPPELAEWCRPEHVVVSAGSRTRLDPVREVYEGARVLATASEGAISVVVREDGSLVCEPFGAPPSAGDSPR